MTSVHRNPEGFDVIGETDAGAVTRIKGTFALCDFGIEFRDRISLAE